MLKILILLVNINIKIEELLKLHPEQEKTDLITISFAEDVMI